MIWLTAWLWKIFAVKTKCILHSHRRTVIMSSHRASCTRFVSKFNAKSYKWIISQWWRAIDHIAVRCSSASAIYENKQSGKTPTGISYEKSISVSFANRSSIVINESDPNDVLRAIEITIYCKWERRRRNEKNTIHTPHLCACHWTTIFGVLS